MTNKERMLTALRRETPDRLPFAPRLDLWFSANRAAGTLPVKYRDCDHHHEIALAEGWALHQINPAYQQVRRPEDNLHWSLGVLSFRETVFNYRFGGDVEIKVDRRPDGRTKIIYRTPKGAFSTTTAYTEEMRRAGASASFIEEHALKGPRDYAPVGYIFEHLELHPDQSDFIELQKRVGDNGLAFTMAGRAASPMQHIQKYFVGATDFFYHYKDFSKEMAALAESLEPFFDQTIEMIGRSAAEAVFWGGNFDDMITYPDYFAARILPWIAKAADRLGRKGIIVSCHCDGENQGLMDLLRDSGMHAAESVCPYPMTKVTIAEYYARWSDKLAIFGGIPSNLLLRESTSEAEFQAYLDDLFPAVAPGSGLIIGVADSVPPGADFGRLQRLGERIADQGRLPLKIRAAGAALARVNEVAPIPEDDGLTFNPDLEPVQKAVLNGDDEGIDRLVGDLLDQGVTADRILHQGLLAAMEVIGQRFKTGQVFIPEVLLSARAMNRATEILEPHLAVGERRGTGRLLIGTVKGDLHDIGKNLVAAMLKGVGFEIRDLGINIPAEEFVKAVKEFQPDLLGLSALLTTTMPQMIAVLDSLTEAGLRDKVKVMIGGAPVNQKFAADIGADGYAADAGQAVSLAKELLGRAR